MSSGIPDIQIFLHFKLYSACSKRIYTCFTSIKLQLYFETLELEPLETLLRTRCKGIYVGILFGSL